MTGLQTVPCHISRMWLDIVLLDQQSDGPAGHTGEGPHPHSIDLLMCPGIQVCDFIRLK